MGFEELIPITMFIVFGYVIKVISDNRTRRAAIEKGLVDENLKYLYYDKLETHLPNSLKWGIVLIALGLGLFIVRMVPSYHANELTFGVMFLSAGVGLIIFYVIATKKVRERALNQKHNAHSE